MSEKPKGLNWDALQPPVDEVPKKSRRQLGLEVTEEQRAEAVAAYLAGESGHDVAFAYGVTSVTIYDWVRRAGHKPRPRGGQ